MLRGLWKGWHNFAGKAGVEQHKENLKIALQDPKIDLASFEKDKIKGTIRTNKESMRIEQSQNKLKSKKKILSHYMR